jgi:hypothetical protein
VQDQRDIDLLPDLLTRLFVEDVGDEGEEEADEEALRGEDMSKGEWRENSRTNPVENVVLAVEEASRRDQTLDEREYSALCRSGGTRKRRRTKMTEATKKISGFLPLHCCVGSFTVPSKKSLLLAITPLMRR